jgi:transcriptional regulator with XRE-family HTH domain
MKTFKYYTRLNSLSCFRRKWGLSQQQVAEQMQISRSMVSMIEHGHRPLPTNILLQLAQLEIKLAGINISAAGKNIGGDAGITAARCKRHCYQLFERETHCRAKAVKLREKLEGMTALYQKNRGVDGCDRIA